jgi:hypothetical protein
VPKTRQMRLNSENITTCATKTSRPLYPEVLILSRKNHSKTTKLKPSNCLTPKSHQRTRRGRENPVAGLRELSVQYEVKDHLDGFYEKSQSI